jgi:hypothetical protein
MKIVQPVQLFIFELKDPKEAFFNVDRLRHFLTGICDSGASLFNWTSENQLTILLMGEMPATQLFLNKTVLWLKGYFQAVRAAWNEPVNEWGQLSVIFHQLKKTLILSEENVVHPAQVSYELLLSELGKPAVERVMETLEPLREELRITLAALFAEDLVLSKTAKRLFIHRNTLLYRLDQIQELTGRDPRCFEDAVYLSTLLKLQEIRSVQVNK